jgi:hypothetical protein
VVIFRADRLTRDIDMATAGARLATQTWKQRDTEAQSPVDSRASRVITSGRRPGAEPGPPEELAPWEIGWWPTTNLVTYRHELASRDRFLVTSLDRIPDGLLDRYELDPRRRLVAI